MSQAAKISLVLILAAVLNAIGTASIEAIVIRHDLADAAYLARGAAPRFAGVGKMLAGGGLRGTGTYLGNGWVLTAAHVADDSTNWTFHLDGADVPVAEVHIHPDWTGDPNDNHDVAVMRLTQPLAGVAALPIATLSAELNDAVDFAGYGFTGTGLTGITNDGGEVLRAGTNTIEFDLNGFGLEYVVTFFDSPSSGVATPLEAQGAFNDSGGPLLRETNGAWEIVGVTSFIQESLDGSGDMILGNYDDLTGFADVPLYANWIANTVATISGDFNGDGMWDALDINALVAVIATMSHDGGFDLTGDGLVDASDLQAWLVEGGAMNPAQTDGNPFLVGDANLDGSVDAQDFIVWNNNKFTASTEWTAGNFQPDNAVDAADFIAWNVSKFQSSANGPSVPEPAGMMMGVCLLALLCVLRRGPGDSSCCGFQPQQDSLSIILRLEATATLILSLSKNHSHGVPRPHC